MNCILIILTLLCSTNIVLSQPPEKYMVNAENVNLRSEPSLNSTIVKQLSNGATVNMLGSKNGDWQRVISESDTGFVLVRYLSLDVSDWTPLNYSSGTQPECENITPLYDKSIDNFLRIKVGSNTNVVVKLMKIEQNGDYRCIRVAYVKSKDQFEIINIPEGKYYIKIAYGSDLRKTIYENKCYIKFMNNSLYKKGTDILDFYKIKMPDTVEGRYVYENWEIPSYEIELDVIVGILDENLDTMVISVDEFNK